MLVRIFVVLLLAPVLAAQNVDYVRVLAPVHLPSGAPGAYGARWETTLWIRNDGDSSMHVFPILNRSCTASFACGANARPYPSIERRETVFFIDVPGTVGDAPAPEGMFFYVERGRLNQLAMQLHGGDATQPRREFTRLPLVPESDFFGDTRSIVSVPVRDDSRISLRVFQLDPSAAAAVRLRVYDAAVISFSGPKPSRLLAETVLEFAQPARGCRSWLNCDESLFYHPGYIVIGDLIRQLPQIQSELGPYGIRIEIEPITPGLQYWPLVTVTENATNHITVYTVR
jgi:hypothetical protein